MTKTNISLNIDYEMSIVKTTAFWDMTPCNLIKE